MLGLDGRQIEQYGLEPFIEHCKECLEIQRNVGKILQHRWFLGRHGASRMLPTTTASLSLVVGIKKSGTKGLLYKRLQNRTVLPLPAPAVQP